MAIEAYIDRSRKAKAHLKMNMARWKRGKGQQKRLLKVLENYGKGGHAGERGQDTQSLFHLGLC